LPLENICSCLGISSAILDNSLHRCWYRKSLIRIRWCVLCLILSWHWINNLVSAVVNLISAIIIRLKPRRRICYHVNECLCQGTIPIVTLLKSLLEITTFHLLKGQAMVINIMVIRWRMIIFLCGCHNFFGFILYAVCTSGHHDERMLELREH
jgi:hypothetical protein